MYDIALFPQKLKSYRELEGYTQLQMSELIGFSPQYYSLVERGIRPPSMDFIRAASDKLDIPIVSLFSDVEPMRLTNRETHEYLSNLSLQDLHKLTTILEALLLDEE